MRLRHLNRHAWPVRRVSFPAFSLVLLSLLGSGRPAVLVIGFAVLMALWPLLVSFLCAQAWWREESNFHSALIASECLLASVVCGLMIVPDLLLLTVCVCLLSASALLLGVFPLALCTLALGAGFGFGRLASPIDLALLTTPILTEALSAGLVLWLVIAVSLAAHRQSVRLAGERGRAVQRVQYLDGYSSRLARYLPNELTALLLQQSAQARPSRLFRRAWLSVVFVDLCGFSRLTRRLEPEELAGILNAYLDGVAGYAERFSAQIGHVAGDGVLVYFEAAGQPGRAATVRRATDFSSKLHAYCGGELANLWQVQGVDASPALRIGIASGYCTLADWGGRRLDYTPIGSPVNRAARLQREADIGGVAVDEPTAGLQSAEANSPDRDHRPQTDTNEARPRDQRQGASVNEVAEGLAGDHRQG